MKYGHSSPEEQPWVQSSVLAAQRAINYAESQIEMVHDRYIGGMLTWRQMEDQGQVFILLAQFAHTRREAAIDNATGRKLSALHQVERRLSRIIFG